MPKAEDLKGFLYENEKSFCSKDKYCNELLSEEEKSDCELLEIVGHNLIKKEIGIILF